MNKYDNSSSTEKSLSLDADGNGYIELESDDCIQYVNAEKDLSSSTVEIRGCYVNKFGRDKRINYYKDKDKTEVQKGVSFASFYLCRNFLPEKLIFEKLNP